MKDRYIHHVTLTTGHVRRSPRSEVAADIFPTLQTLLADALSAGQQGVEIPHTGGFRMTAGVMGGKCAGISVYGPEPLPTELGDLPSLVAYIGIAGHSRCGSRMWREMHRVPAPEPYATDPARCPPEPWCGAILHVGAAIWPAANDWLGDFERCMAWAFLERQ